MALLLFATLVVGIAGHSDLKQAGRMGWKSLVCFEVVSTIAFFIGLFAINIRQDGVGVEVPDVVHQVKVPHVEQVSGKKWLDRLMFGRHNCIFMV